MEWINQAINDFCKLSNLECDDFLNRGVVLISIENVGELSIELIKNEVVMFLVRSLEMHNKSKVLLESLKKTHIELGWPFLIRVGMLGEDDLVFSAAIPSEDVALPVLERAFNLLKTLHEEVMAL